MLGGMRIQALAFCLLLAAGGSARGGTTALPAYYTELPPGRYSVGVRGMLCTVCARAIAAEWAKVPGVEKASMDFDKDEGVVVVRLDRTLPVSALRKALRRAEKTANLGGRYELLQIQYLP